MENNIYLLLGTLLILVVIIICAIRYSRKLKVMSKVIAINEGNGVTLYTELDQLHEFKTALCILIANQEMKVYKIVTNLISDNEAFKSQGTFNGFSNEFYDLGLSPEIIKFVKQWGQYHCKCSNENFNEFINYVISH